MTIIYSICFGIIMLLLSIFLMVLFGMEDNDEIIDSATKRMTVGAITLVIFLVLWSIWLIDVVKNYYKL